MAGTPGVAASVFGAAVPLWAAFFDAIWPGGTSVFTWRVGVGLKNFTQFFSDSRINGPFFEILAWTFAFAFLSVATTFAKPGTVE